MVQSKKDSGDFYHPYVSNFAYNAAGAVTAMKFGNGRWESTQFNSRLQPTMIGLGSGPTSQNLLKLEYSYGTTQNNGNILSQTITVPTVGVNPGFVAEQEYTYDSLNRIKDATETISNAEIWKQAFVYDRYGNRNFDESETTTLIKNCGSSPNFTVCPADARVLNPEILASNNRLKADQDGDSINDYLYDTSGNTTRDAESRKFTYDAENKQVKVETVDGSGNPVATVGKYFYDGDGRRIKKIVPSTDEVTVFVYDATGKLIGEYSTEISQTPKVSYTTADHLGSPRILTDENGQVISRRDFHPFGEEVFTAERIAALGYQSDDVRQKFTGYERDNETDLDFAQARYFNSGFGRFSSPDSIFLSKQKMFDAQQWNLYSYVRNTPIRFTDPTGKYVCTSDVKKCEQFEKSRQEALKSDDADTVRGAKAFGDPSQKKGDKGDNGVYLQFADKLKGDRGGRVTRHEGGIEEDSNSDNGMRAAVDVTIQTDQIGNEEVLAHEGSHVADRQDFIRALAPDGSSDKANILNITLRDSERRAYKVSVGYVLRGNGTVNFGPCGVMDECKFKPGMSQTQIDRMIDDLLEKQYKNLDSVIFPEFKEQ